MGFSDSGHAADSRLRTPQLWGLERLGVWRSGTTRGRSRTSQGEPGRPGQAQRQTRVRRLVVAEGGRAGTERE